MQRREFLTTFAAAGATAAVQDQPVIQRKGRIKQALMRNNFGANTTLSFEDMCRVAARVGCKGFDLIGPQDWPTLKKYGLIATMGPAAGVTIQDGLIRKELHDQVEKSIADLGFTGYIAHEFRPSPGRDPVKSIEQAVEILDV